MAMRRRLAVAALCAGLSLPASAEDAPRRQRSSYASPTALIAAEIAFAQLAQEKGQWTAFRETAAPDGEMFVPQRVNARTWLKGRADPPVAVKWQPHAVWMSCDGSAGFTRGAWQGAGTGYFTTVWQRQPLKRSKPPEYRWVLDQGDGLAQPLVAPEMIAGRVADCRPVAGAAPTTAAPAGVDAKDGASADRTLQWSSWVWPDGRRRVSAWLWNGTGFDVVLDVAVAAPPAPPSPATAPTAPTSPAAPPR